MLKAFDFIIFGGAGDLALRKLIPAWYRAFRDGQVPEGSRIFGTVRKPKLLASYKQVVRNAVKEHLREGEFDEKVWAKFETLIHGVFINITEEDEHWGNLAETLKAGNQERIFYLATPPSVFASCCGNLSRVGLITKTSRVVVEKPLGYDKKSAEEINAKIAEYFEEDSIFRIDHYLGKEAVQNLLVLRFTNGIFEHLWDSSAIDHVEISICETVGLEGRAGFYDGAGAMRDMVQNHLMQLLCLIAMERPSKLSADSIRAEKLKVIESLRPLVDDEVVKNTVRGQYISGPMDGSDVPGYLDELGRPSSTETFVAIRAHLDNPRWSGVPFYLRTGKRLKKRFAEIIIQYKSACGNLYPASAGEMTPNRLVIQLQPDEKIQVIITSSNLQKHDVEFHPVVLNLDFADTYTNHYGDAYKRLMLDAAANNPALFIHRSEVEAAWAWIDPIIEAWKQPENHPQSYTAGSWGPQRAMDLLENEDRSWFNLGEGKT